MKKLLIATILATGLTAFLPSASAHDSERVFVGYDRCGRPVYQEVCRQNYRSYDYQPSYQQSYEPRQSYYYSQPRETRYRDYEDDRCYAKKKKYCEPRFRSPLSFVFGF